jgi:hypothetical protein
MSDVVEMVQRLRGRIDRARLDIDAAMMLEHQAAEITALRDKLATAIKERDMANDAREAHAKCTTALIAGAEAATEAAEARALAATAESDRLRRALVEADRQLTNLQPHIPQSCYPGHTGFIDTHVDLALEAISQALKEQTP